MPSFHSSEERASFWPSTGTPFELLEFSDSVVFWVELWLISCLPFSFATSGLDLPLIVPELKTGFFPTGTPLGNRRFGPSEWTIDANELEEVLLEVEKDVEIIFLLSSWSLLNGFEGAIDMLLCMFIIGADVDSDGLWWIAAIVETLWPGKPLRKWYCKMLHICFACNNTFLYNLATFPCNSFLYPWVNLNV